MQMETEPPWMYIRTLIVAEKHNDNMVYKQ
jgi:hypothetical protein